LNLSWKKAEQILHYQIQAFRSRPGRLYALLVAPRRGVCAEIGVWAGDFSARVVQLRKPKELHLVDPWQFVPSVPERMYGGAVASSQADMDGLMASVAARFAGNTNVRLHRSTSIEAAQRFQDGYFDWVYLDGDHSYESVLADLHAWFPKVKVAGKIVCDDYTWVDESGMRSVKAAIDTFLKKSHAQKGHLVFGQFLIRKGPLE
jgi:methyltransferase family protein